MAISKIIFQWKINCFASAVKNQTFIYLRTWIFSEVSIGKAFEGDEVLLNIANGFYQRQPFCIGVIESKRSREI